MAEGLYVEIRTPDDVPFGGVVDSVRLPTESGLVGLRRRAERMVTLVESGLVLLSSQGRTTLAATAGGLLEHLGDACTLYSPFAVVGQEEEVLAALERIRVTPDAELAARRQLGELEQRIVNELGRRQVGAGPREVRHEPPA